MASLRLIGTALLTLTILPSLPRAIAEPVYDAQDITGWSPSQLATLPYFKHYVVLAPAGAPADFVPHAQNLTGLVVGTTSYPGWYSELATLCQLGVTDQLTPMGDYYWSYLYWDGQDYHFQNGYVRYTRANDVNFAGITVGESTVTGSGEYSSQYTSTATVHDPFDGSTNDVTPDATRARALAINNAGVIAGSMDDHPLGTGGFRRMPDGQMFLLDPLGGYRAVPAAINRFGLIVGGANRTPLYSIAGSATAALAIPGTFDSAQAMDVNDSAWIVGDSWKTADVVEHFATVWEPSAGPTWTAYDLNEVCVTEDIILERALAINEQGYIIARGRPDGTDVLGTKLYFLTPETLVDPPCSPDIGVHPRPVTIDEGLDVTLTVVLASGVNVGFQWQHEVSPGVFDDLSDGTTPNGAVIVGAQTDSLSILNVSTLDTGAYRVVAANACGGETSNPAVLQVVPPPSGCPGDIDGDGSTTVFDFGIFASNFGQTVAAGTNGDLDGSGVVDVFDFGIFASDFGCTP